MIFNYESFVEPVSVEPSEDPMEPSKEPSETYRSNGFMSISEQAKRVRLGKDDMGNCKKILNMMHLNILSILDVTDEEVIYWQPKEEDVFGSLDKFLDHQFFLTLASRPFETGNLKLFMYDIMDGLVGLHAKDLHHGNLCIESIYFCLNNGSRRPIFKLGNFKYSRGSKVLAMLKDWQDMGFLLENLMDLICVRWRTNYKFLEFRDLCTSLKNNAMGVNTSNFKWFSDPAKMSEQCRQFVIEHPGMLEVSDRPSYILTTSAFVETANMGNKIKDEDFDNDLSVDGSLVDALKKEGSISCSFEDLPDGRKGEAYLSMVRNLLDHQPLRGILAKAFGGTSVQIDDYFRIHQPKLVLILYNLVKGTKFKFESFVSKNHEAFLLE